MVRADPIPTSSRAGITKRRATGRPLYTFAADAPGETKGDGVGGNWRVAKPA